MSGGLRNPWQLAGLLAPITLLLGLFFCVPLLIMVIYSLLEPAVYGGVSWNFYPYNYGRILGAPLGGGETFDAVYFQILLRSLKLALITVGVSLLVSYPAALWASRLSGRTKTLVLFLITLPFFANLLIRIYAWMLILRPTGFLNAGLKALGAIDRPLMLMFSEAAVVIGLVYILVPFMFLPIYASAEKLDDRLVQASYDLGANPAQTFLRVILPLTMPGVIGGCIIVFIPSLGNFVVPSLLGGAKVLMLGSIIEQQFLYARNWPFGAALAMMVMTIVLLLLMTYVLSEPRRGGSGGEAIRAGAQR